jgi:hypothetical protein
MRSALLSFDCGISLRPELSSECSFCAQTIKPLSLISANHRDRHWSQEACETTLGTVKNST